MARAQMMILQLHLESRLTVRMECMFRLASTIVIPPTSELGLGFTTWNR
jgi:hypothetical protein